jgi:hypothetical protein
MLLAVWDEPPLDFDPDTLIRRVEQKKSRRRALVGVGVATAMIAVVSLALPGLLPRGGDGQLASEGTPSSSAPPSESVNEKASRIGDKLAEKLKLRMPNLKDVYADFRPGVYAYQPNSPTTPPSRPNDPELSGFVYLTDDVGPTALQVIITRNRGIGSYICSGATTCRDAPLTDGTSATQAEFAQGESITQAMTLRKFPSGYYVQISSYNQNPANGYGLRATAPVSVDALTALVTDPDVRWE